MREWIMSLLRALFGTFTRKSGTAAAPTIAPPDAPTQEVVVPESERPVVVDIPARLYTAYKTPKGLPNIQMFDVKSINDSIERHVSAMKPGETVVAVAYVDRSGANVAVVGKVNHPKIPGELKWTVYGTREWSGDWNVGAGGRWSI